jgi:hypothetical protein
VTGKSTLLLMIDAAPHARDISRSVTGHVDAIARAMLRRNTSTSSLKQLSYCVYVLRRKFIRKQTKIKTQLHHALAKNDCSVIFVDYFDDHWYRSPKARTGREQ